MIIFGIWSKKSYWKDCLFCYYIYMDCTLGEIYSNHCIIHYALWSPTDWSWFGSPHMSLLCGSTWTHQCSIYCIAWLVMSLWITPAHSPHSACLLKCTKRNVPSKNGCNGRLAFCKGVFCICKWSIHVQQVVPHSNIATS